MCGFEGPGGWLAMTPCHACPFDDPLLYP
jgi:hypothetical protein